MNGLSKMTSGNRHRDMMFRRELPPVEDFFDLPNWHGILDKDKSIMFQPEYKGKRTSKEYLGSTFWEDFFKEMNKRETTGDSIGNLLNDLKAYVHRTDHLKPGRGITKGSRYLSAPTHIKPQYLGGIPKYNKGEEVYIKRGKDLGQWEGTIKDIIKTEGQENLKSILSKNKVSGNYRNANVKTNLKDELLNAITEKLFFNRYEEITPGIGFGGQFGKPHETYKQYFGISEDIKGPLWNWGGHLGLNKKGKPGNIGFNIGRSF